MALDAETPADRCAQLTTLTQKLTTLVVDETELLDARRIEEAMARQPEVLELGDHYRRECVRIKADPTLIAPAPQDLRDRLRVETEKLHAALDRHEIALNAIRKVSEGLIRSIADYVTDTRATQSAYGPKAAIAARDTGAAITLNKRV